MPKFFPIKVKKSARRYPIRRDERGKSARQRAFDLFDVGFRPVQVARSVEDVKLRTIYRYFEDWKNLPRNFGIEYRAFKALVKQGVEFSEETIKLLSDGLGMSEEEVIERLQKPWGIKQLLMGQWPNYARERQQSEQEARLEAALMLVDFVVKGLISTEMVIARLEDLKNRARETSRDQGKEKK